MKKEAGDEDDEKEEMIHTGCTHHFPTQEAPQDVKEQKRTGTESQFAIKCPPVKIGTQCWHSDFANSSPKSKQSEMSMMSP